MLSFPTFLALALLPALANGEMVVDVEFRAPLFCENDRKTISYVIVSLNVDSFSKVTDLAYFTDGYPNIVSPDFYSASRSSTKGGEFRVELKKLLGSKASEFHPQKSGALASCVIRVDRDWKSKLKRTQDVEIFETDKFDAICSFPMDARETCRTSKSLAKKLYLSNPLDGRELRYDTIFRYKTWK